MMKTYTEHFLIRSYQADVSSRIRPGAILEIMQEMAGTHANLLGVGGKTLMEKNMIWVLSRVEVSMTRWPMAGETVEVETFPMPNRRMFFPRYYIFRDDKGQTIGTAGSLWLIIDATSRTMCNPGDIAPLLPDNSDLTAPMGLPSTVAAPHGEVSTFRSSFTPVYTDFDCNGHVNNTRYLDWCCNALGVDIMRSHTFTSFALNFNREVLAEHELELVLGREGNEFTFAGMYGDVYMFNVGGVMTPAK